MGITKMELFSANPSAPELALGGFMPSNDPVQVLDIQGLGPVKAETESTPFATGRGELYQGSSIGKRNIVMTLGLNPDWATQTMATLRQLLYAYLLPGVYSKLRFFSDYLPTVDIEGIVESFEPNIFSQDPQIQVSVLCHKPDFQDVDATVYTGVVDDGSIELEFDYIGNIATGFELRIDRTVANPSYTGSVTVSVASPVEPLPQVITIDPVTINTVDYFKLSTRSQLKRVQSIDIADGSTANKLDKMTAGSVWPVLHPGQNIFSVAAEENDQVWTLAYFNRFAGL